MTDIHPADIPLDIWRVSEKAASDIRALDEMPPHSEVEIIARAIIDSHTSLNNALDLYRMAAHTDVTMEGVNFIGVNRSAFKRAWDADRAIAAAREA